MATVDLFNRASVRKNLPLELFLDTTNYADFHIRSETTYPDLTITTEDMPFTNLTMRDGTIKNWFFSGFNTDEDLINENDNTTGNNGNLTTTAVVTPSRTRNDDTRYNWYSEISFFNIQTSGTNVQLISGELPKGLTLATGLLGEGSDIYTETHVIFSGQIEGDLFDISMEEYQRLYDDWYSNEQTTFESIEYIDNPIDKNVLTNPSTTFSIGDKITSVDEDYTETREINNIYTELSKTAIDVNTYVPVVTNYVGDYVTTYNSFNVHQAQKLDDYGYVVTNEYNEPYKDPDWRGYISNIERTIFAQYTDIKHNNSSLDKFYKTYTFTLGIYNPSDNYLLDQKTFSMEVQASPESLRDNYIQGLGIQIDENKHFHELKQTIYDLLH